MFASDHHSIINPGTSLFEDESKQVQKIEDALDIAHEVIDQEDEGKGVEMGETARIKFDKQEQEDHCGICLQPFEEGEMLKALLCQKDKN